MSIFKEIWHNALITTLEEDDSFLNTFTSHDQYVNNKKVHVPKEGEKPAVLKNPTLPLTIKEREDVDIDYDIDDYATEPTTVADYDDAKLAYQKLKSIAAQQIRAIREEIGKIMARFVVADGVHRIATTGDENAPASGDPLDLIIADLVTAAEKLDIALAPKDNRFLMLHPTLFYHLFKEDIVIDRNKSGKITIKDFKIKELANFYILPSRTGIQKVNASGVIHGTASNNNKETGIFYQSDAVAKALGNIRSFSTLGDPTYLGDIVNAAISGGGKVLRPEHTGIFYRGTQA